MYVQYLFDSRSPQTWQTILQIMKITDCRIKFYHEPKMDRPTSPSLFWLILQGYSVTQFIVEGHKMRSAKLDSGKQSQGVTNIVIIIIIIIIIKIKIIAYKGAIRDFLQSPHCAVNRLQRVCSSGPGAIVCKSCATHQALITCNISCDVPLGTTGQLSCYV